MSNAFINGFIKRASEYGFNQNEAVELYKHAGLFGASAPDFPAPGLPGGRPGGTGDANGHRPSTLGSDVMNSTMGTGIGAAANIYGRAIPAVSSGIGGLFKSTFNSGGAAAALAQPQQAPAAMPPPPTLEQRPVAPPTPQAAPVDPNINFRKYHGTNFDPHSAMDRFKMQQLQQAQSSGGSMVRAADIPYRPQFARR